MVSQFPNSAIPIIEKATSQEKKPISLIKEYPDNYLPFDISGFDSSQAPVDLLDRKMTTIEDIDFGHRHYSILHWLFPNNFLPYLSSTQGEISENLFVSALSTIVNKKSHKGSHTNWSLIWELCLLSRLSFYDQQLSSQIDETINVNEIILASFQKFFGSYIKNNFLTVHPSLNALEHVTSSVPRYSDQIVADIPITQRIHGKDSVFQCSTCFEEMNIGKEMRATFKQAAYLATAFPDSVPKDNWFEHILSQLRNEKGFETNFGEKVFVFILPIVIVTIFTVSD